MGTKPLYLYRITDGAYFIYKLSKYAMFPIELIHVGVAYTRQGDFTKKFKQLRKKYDLKKYDNHSIIYADTYKEFLYLIYLDYDIPPKVLEVIKPYVLTIMNERVDFALKDINK